MRTRNHLMILHNALLAIGEAAERAHDPESTLAWIADYARSLRLDVRACRNCGRPYIYHPKTYRQTRCPQCRWKRHLMRECGVLTQ